jgi:integrase
MAEWMNVAKKPSVGEATFADYQADIRRYIMPTLGSMPMGRLTVVDIQALYTDMLEKGLSVGTIRRAHTILNQALKQAVRWKKLPFNPAADVDLPRNKNRKKVIRSFDSDQLAAFLEAAALTPYSTLFEVACASGARPGDYLGLGWIHVDWKLGGIRIERAVVRPKGAKPFLGPPKTPESRRFIPLGPIVMDSLRDHRRAQNEWRLSRGPKWNGELDLVFPDQNGNLLAHRNIARRVFKAILEKAGLPDDFNIYCLRHTMATLLLQDGENSKIVQERMGHASIVQTHDTYTHVLPTMQQAAASKMEAIMFRRR